MVNLMPKMPQVSVIIPCYNYAHYLPDAIESCLNQTYPNLEIIVVDASSIDNTREVITRYPKVKYVYQETQNLAAVRNTGWKASSGEFLQFLDADDVLLPTKIARSVEAFTKHPEVGLVHTHYEYRTADLKQPLLQQPEKVRVPSKNLSTFLISMTRAPFTVHAALLRRKIIEQVGGFNESLQAVEDWYMWVSLAIQDVSFYFLDDVLVWYRFATNSMSRNRLAMSEARLRAYEALAEKHLPSELDLNSLIAGRHFVYALELWAHERRREARTEFRQAIALQHQSRMVRRALIVLSYFTSEAVAAKMLHLALTIRDRAVRRQHP